MGENNVFAPSIKQKLKLLFQLYRNVTNFILQNEITVNLFLNK